MSGKEATVLIKISKLLETAGWRFSRPEDLKRCDCSRHSPTEVAHSESA